MILYHNTINENAVNIAQTGIIAGIQKNKYGKGSEAEGSGIWCRNQRTYGNGGATITFEIDDNDKDLWKANDTEYVIYRNIKPSEIKDIDLVIASKIVANPKRKDSNSTIVESDIPEAIKYWGKDKLLEVLNENKNLFVKPYNYEIFESMLPSLEKGRKYFLANSKLVETRLLYPLSNNTWNLGRSNKYKIPNIKSDKDKNEKDSKEKLKEQDLNNSSEERYLKNLLDKINDSFLVDYDTLINDEKRLIWYWGHERNKGSKSKYPLNWISQNQEFHKNIIKKLQDLKSKSKSKKEEKASIDWNNWLTKEEIEHFIEKDDKIEAAEDIIYSKEFKPRYQDLHNDLQKKFKNSWTKLELIQDLNDFYHWGHLYYKGEELKPMKSKIEEVSRNQMVAKTKAQTKSRYDRAQNYKGFSIIDLDTTNILRNNSIAVTCRVGDYHDSIEIEDILYWIQVEAEKNKNNQINMDGVRTAILNAVDGKDIKVDCECRRF